MHIMQKSVYSNPAHNVIAKFNLLERETKMNKNAPMTQGQYQELRDFIERENRSLDNNISEKIESMDEKIESMDEKIESMENKLTDTNNKVEALQKGVSNLQSVKTDMNQVKQDVQEIKTDMKQVKEDVDIISSDYGYERDEKGKLKLA